MKRSVGEYISEELCSYTLAPDSESHVERCTVLSMTKFLEGLIIGLNKCARGSGEASISEGDTPTSKNSAYTF